MKYFLHDSSSFYDEKITMLFIKFGYEGLGLFYTVLEKLAKQEQPVATDVLKHQLKVGKRLSKIWKYMEEIGLISSTNGETFNKQLLNFSEKYQIKKEKNRKRISQWRENQEDTENVTRYKDVRNKPKVKKSKVNIYSDEVKNFTHSLLQYFTIKPDKIDSWYKDVDLLTRVDHYDYKTIEQIVKTFRNDDFWSQNFLSLLKLRKKNKDGIKFIEVFKDKLKTIKPKTHKPQIFY